MAVAPRPTPMTEISEGLRPPAEMKWFRIMWVLEPGAETPTFRPLRSFGDLYAFALAVAMPIAICGARPCCTKHWRYWPLGCMLSVCSYAPDTTSALPPITARSACEPQIGREN